MTLGGLWENRRILAYCVFVSLGATTFGFHVNLLLGYESFRIQFGNEYKGQYVVPAIHQSIWSCTKVPGGLLGSLCAGLIGNRLGRRFLITIASFIFLCATLAYQLALDWRVVAAGRFLTFLGMSMYTVAAVTYISEIAPSKYRGMMLMQMNFFILIGQFLTACVLKGTQTLSGNLQFRIPMILQYIVPGILLAFTWLIPESPPWLMGRGELEAARASLVRLHGSRQDIEDRLLEIKPAATQQKASSQAKYITCLRGSDLKRTIIATGMGFSLQLSGVAFVYGYSAYFFHLSGIPESLAFTINAVMFALQLLANILSWYLIERFGRRPLLLTGMPAIIVSYFIIGGIGTSTYMLGALPKVVVTLMVIITIASQLSISSVAWAVAGEVSSLELRASTQSIVGAFNSTVGFGVGFAIPYMLNPDKGNLGPKIGFVFAGLSTLVILFMYFMVPELKGRTFNEVDYMFQKGVPIRKFKEFVIPCGEQVQETNAGTVDRITQVTV